MALPEPENTEIEHATLDSGVHVRDTERAPATEWQVFIGALLVVTILIVFFYGLTEQRIEVAGVPPSHSDVAAPLGADKQTANAPPAATKPPAPKVDQGASAATTGAAPKR